jgi:hypothetical protein
MGNHPAFLFSGIVRFRDSNSAPSCSDSVRRKN